MAVDVVKPALPLLSRLIAAHREARGLSQAELAEALGTDTTTVSRWESGRNKPKGKVAVTGLRDMLGIAQADLDRAFLQWSEVETGARAVIRGYDTLAALRLTEGQMIARLIEIDRATLPDLTVDLEGTAEQWLPIFRAAPYAWRLLTLRDTIIGYWHYLSLDERHFAMAKAGTLREGHLHPDALVHLVNPASARAYKMFISMVALDPRWMRPEYATQLLLSLVGEFEHLARLGFVFSEICAVAWTPEGRQLCEDARMNQIAQQSGVGPQDVAPIYHLTGAEIARRPALAGNRSIAALYRQSFG